MKLIVRLLKIMIYSDGTVEKKYQLAITENLNRFVSIIIDRDLNSCS